MSQIDINNIINVSISTAPTLLSSDNVNVIGIFTKETPLYPVDNYVKYTNTKSCANDWGVDSITYKMVNNIFSQNLNILAGNGFVVVFPLLSSVTISATSGYIDCINLIFNKFKSVEDGSFKIKVDAGSETAITGCDFSSCSSLSDVATVLQNKLTTATIGATVSASSNELVFKSNTTGASSKVVITSDTTGTDLTTLNYFNIEKANKVDGKDSYTGSERLQDAVIRCQELIFFEAILASYSLSDDEINNTAENIQSLNKMLFVCKTSLSDCISSSGTFATIKNKGYTHTRCLYNGNGEEFLFTAGYASKALSVNFSGTNTANNLHTKSVVGIEPDQTISDTSLTQLYNNGVDCYPSMKGLGIIYCSGKNEWCDTVLFLNWLKMALETAGFNCLRATPTKIPQTENGITTLINAYKDVLEQSKRLNYVAPGSWNLPYTFGDQELFNSNIEQVGYYIYSIPLSEQSAEERTDRDAPLIQCAAKLSGAINKNSVIVYVNN